MTAAGSEREAPPLEQLAEKLARAMPALDADGQRLSIALYRLLAEGKPVPPRRLAEEAGVTAKAVNERLDAWPGVYFGEGGVVGFWGLALEGMPHRLTAGGIELRAWCAWDTLFLPELIGTQAAVESACAVTGEAVTVTVDPPNGVSDVSPETAVLSFLQPDRPFDADVVMSFCHFVHFFQDSAVAERWTSEQAGTFALSVDDGFEVGRLTNRARFGGVLQ
ncbi:MAG: organomercurial lyase [Thermoleophilaceae bacterium]